MKPQQLAGAEGGHRINAAVVIGELDLEGIGGPLFDHRADLATNKALAWQVFEECDDGEVTNFADGVHSCIIQPKLLLEEGHREPA